MRDELEGVRVGVTRGSTWEPSKIPESPFQHTRQAALPALLYGTLKFSSFRD